MELMVSTKRKVEETTADPETVPVSAEGRLLKSKKVLQQMMSRKHPTTVQTNEPMVVDNEAEEPLQKSKKSLRWKDQDGSPFQQIRFT